MCPECYEEVMICLDDSGPVCGVDGNTYSTYCDAFNERVEVDCEWECPCTGGCGCLDVDDPVCGMDDQTYSNSCYASCFYNMEVECDGACPCTEEIEVDGFLDIWFD